jgi:class 3 adenylate cyclase
VLSALDEIGSVVRCIELGAEDYLPKPFDPVLLRARIGACLEKKRLRDQEIQLRSQLQEWNKTLEQRVQEQVTQLERLGRLKRFFSPQLAELIVAGGAEDPLKTHRREVTVVFLDLRGFTAFAETAEPEEVMGVLREYHAAMGKLILEHEGTLERFTGDGMMIFFNDPVEVANPAERAIRMALAMRERVKELTVKWRKLGYELDFGVGIAQGYATIGGIGFEGRWDYGAIGTVTNLASRLCGEAKPSQILVSQRLLGTVEELVEVEPVGELSLKGFHRPVTAHNILRMREVRGKE